MFRTNARQHDVHVLFLGPAHGPEKQQQDDDEDLAAQLVQLCPALFECAAHVAARRFDDDSNRCFERVLGLASLGDGPLQRLARIMVDGLVRRRLGRTINRALIDPSSYLDKRAARCSFVKLLPFLRVSHVAINRVVLDAMENEKFVHIIDLSGPAADPRQWLKLMRAFRARPEGAPHFRITVVHDDGAFLADSWALLHKEAVSLGMVFSFHGFHGRLETLDFGNLHAALAMKSGYACAFSCALQMHRLLAVDDDDATSSTGVVPFQQAASMAWTPGASSFVQYAHQGMIKMNRHPDPSPTTPLSPIAPTPSPPCLVPPPPLTRFLHAVRAASPKVLAVVEQEASHNGPDFTVRFQEALHYYAALFDALDDSVRAECQAHEERAQVEQVLLGEEIKDMLVRDGAERHERHEPLHQWAARMASAGFGAVPLSYVAKMEADEVLRKIRLRGYENRGHENSLLLCRSGRPLYAVSAWRPWSNEALASVSSEQQHMVVPGPIISTWTWPQQQAPLHNFTS